MSARTAPTSVPLPGTTHEGAAAQTFRVPRIRGWLLFTVAVVGAFILLIYGRTALDRSAFDLAALESEIAAAESRYSDLRLEVARLQSPDLVVARAGDLGLVYPNPEELRRVVVEGASVTPTDIDECWTELKALLSSQP